MKPWVVPPPSNSHHQDDITFLVGDPYKPSFPLLLGGGTTLVKPWTLVTSSPVNLAVRFAGWKVACTFHSHTKKLDKIQLNHLILLMEKNPAPLRMPQMLFFPTIKSFWGIPSGAGFFFHELYGKYHRIFYTRFSPSQVVQGFDSWTVVTL